MTTQKIASKYKARQHNADNYQIGGGLSESKFASQRHEDARNDSGKLTEGQATQLFKKATGLEIAIVKAVINHAVPNMEWHHAGKLPKSYGGGMKKTYFLNAEQIADLAENFDSYLENYKTSLSEKTTNAQLKEDLAQRKLNFLKENAKPISRQKNTPQFFYETDREMIGKYGWFTSYGKSYNTTEYKSGWAFETEEKYNEFLNIK